LSLSIYTYNTAFMYDIVKVGVTLFAKNL